MTPFFSLAVLAALLGWPSTAPADSGARPQATASGERGAVVAPEAAGSALRSHPKLDPVLGRLVSQGRSIAALSAVGGAFPRDVRVEVTAKGDVLVPCLIRSNEPAETQRRIADLGGTHRATAGPIVVAVLRSEEVETAAGWPEVVSIAPSYIRRPLLDASRPATGADQVHAGLGLPAAYTGKGVIVGIVDTGIDIGHPDFSTANGSRILSIWDVSGVPQGGEPRVCSASQIASGTCSQVDLTGHGTHVAGIAAGNGRAQREFLGMAPEADLIVAKAVRTPKGTDVSDDDMIAASQYIFQEAQRLGRPAVVNLSVGGLRGPLDGTSELETALEALTGSGRVVVAAAGNSSGEPVHLGYEARGTALYGANETEIIPAGSPQTTEIDIWYPSGSISTGLIVYFPGEEPVPSDPVGPGQTSGPQTLVSEGGVTLANYEVDALTSSYPTNGDRMVRITLQPTVEGARYNPKYTLYAFGSGTLDAWISNGQFGTETRGNRKPGDVQKTVVSPATGRAVIAAGAHTTKVEWVDADYDSHRKIDCGTVGELACFSSRGPTRDGRPKPDFSAPGQVIVASLSDWAVAAQPSDQVLPGNKYMVKWGTSLSAAHVTGAVALMLQANRNLDPEGARTVLRSTATRDTYTGAAPDPNVWGAGKMNAYQAVKAAGGSPAVPDFLLQVSPSAVTLPVGGSATATVGCSASGGFASPVNLSAAGVPSGATVAFSSPSIVCGASTATVTVSAGTASPGSYTISVSGSSGSLLRSAVLGLTVQAAPGTPDFLLQLSPSSVTVPVGGSGSATVGCSASGGFASPVNLSATGAPADATVSFSRPSIVCGASTATVTVAAGAASPGSYSISVSGSSGSLLRSAVLGLTVQTASASSTLFVPVVTKTQGASGSFYTSELTFTNRGARDATLQLFYTAASGGGTGTGSASLPAGRQLVVPDAIDYLRSRGVPIPAEGNRLGTLRLVVTGVASTSDVSVLVRTTTPVPAAAPTGAAGLAYAGVPAADLLSGPALLCGLRRDTADRSNIAVQNAGEGSAGPIGLRITLVSGQPPRGSVVATENVELGPGGFRQIEAPQGFFGWARVERTSGTAPWYAYAVINDNFNSDGSFVVPVPEAALQGKAGLTLPVALETSTFSTEAILANVSDQDRRVRLDLYADALGALPASLDVDMPARSQVSLPNLVDRMRAMGVAIPTGIAGPVVVTSSTGSTQGLVAGARSGSAGGGGRYALYYAAVPYGETSYVTAWVSGLQQTATSRSNLAIVNTGEADGSPSTFRIEVFDGDSGRLTGEKTVTVGARRFFQENAILQNLAPGTSKAWARVTKTSGLNPFIAYGVINDGAAPGQRSGDGAFVLSE